MIFNLHDFQHVFKKVLIKLPKKKIVDNYIILAYFEKLSSIFFKKVFDKLFVGLLIILTYITFFMFFSEFEYMSLYREAILNIICTRYVVQNEKIFDCQ
jgi:hypothetical protein